VSRLTIELPDGRSFDVALERGPMNIGRSPQNEVCLPSLSLSRHHARLHGQGREWRLEDSGSRNGTFVNGRPVGVAELSGTGDNAVELRDGDEIRLGDVKAIYHLDRTPSVQLTPDPMPRGDQTFFLDRDSIDLKRYAAEERTRREASGEMPNVWMVLGEAASAMIADHPLDRLLEVTLDLAMKAVPAQRCAVLLRRADGELETRASRNLSQDQTLGISRTIAQAVLEEKRAVLTVDAQSDQRFEAAASLRIQGIRSVLCVPLLDGDDVRGMLYADSMIGRRAFHESDLRLLGLIGNMTAVKLSNLDLLEQQIDKERMEEQIEVAQRIQRRLYPQQNPDIAGYEIHGVSQPCYEIGGDSFDFVRRAGGRIGFLVADVSGKGVGAAILMSAFQASLRTLAKGDSSPTELMQRVNEVLCDSATPGKFVTAFYAELDVERHTLEYVNAGHNASILLGSGAPTLLESTGPVTGLLPRAVYGSKTVVVEPGGLLAIYSDGFSEAEDPSGEEYGLDRLIGLVGRLRGEAPKDAAQAMLQELVAYESTAPRKDDCTLLLVKRLPAP
jgi:sigma-B regulation protein RsbU (phosphoserine phosphatase)